MRVIERFKKAIVDRDIDYRILRDYDIHVCELTGNEEYPFNEEADERIKARFREDRRSEDWEFMKSSMHPAIDTWDDLVLGSIYYGSLVNPSGKYYTSWANGNTTPIEARIDTLWWEAFNEVAEEHGCYVDAGENDPTDVFIRAVLLRVGDKVQFTERFVFRPDNDAIEKVIVKKGAVGTVTSITGDDERIDIEVELGEYLVVAPLNIITRVEENTQESNAGDCSDGSGVRQAV